MNNKGLVFGFLGLLILTGSLAQAEMSFPRQYECNLGGVSQQTNRVFLKQSESKKIYAFVQEDLRFEDIVKTDKDVDFSTLSSSDLLTCKTSSQSGLPIECAGENGKKLIVSANSVAGYNFITATLNDRSLGDCSYLDLSPGSFL